ncbi:MAG: cytochrome P450 [Gordonia sp. (in: high G+C Gram-positive bacteria)]
MSPLLTRPAARRGPAGWHCRADDAPSGVTAGECGAGPLIDGPIDALVPPTSMRPPMRPTTIRTSVRFVVRQGDLMFRDAAEHGEVLRYTLAGGPGEVVTVCNPAHIKALMTADPRIVPSATRRSPLAPIVGPESVLTSIGSRHRQQRAMLLPRFHGKAVAAYTEAIEVATATRIDAWPAGVDVRLAGLAQQITLDIIMSAVFGIAIGRRGEAPSMSPAEQAVRTSTLRLLRASAHPAAAVAQLLNARTTKPVGLTTMLLAPLDRAVFALLAERRAAGDDRADVVTLLLGARDDSGQPLSDSEIRDELLTLVLAGHETTANTVAWTFERLTRNPRVYDDARDAARAGDADYLEALLNESMRSRPVVPIVARELLTPWHFGSHEVDAGVTAFVSILLLHHRDDLYPRPFAFDPQRFLGVRPSPHELMPFGGGIRRCLGAPLAMAELRVVVAEILRRVDLETHDRPAERPRHRNVTMIPGEGGRVRARAVRRTG